MNEEIDNELSINDLINCSVVAIRPKYQFWQQLNVEKNEKCDFSDFTLYFPEERQMTQPIIELRSKTLTGLFALDIFQAVLKEFKGQIKNAWLVKMKNNMLSVLVFSTWNNKRVIIAPMNKVNIK